MRKRISVYTDGSSSGKTDGPTGWGWLVVCWDDDEIKSAGSEGAPNGSNNTAELQAAICGLRDVVSRKLHVGNDVVLVSDSLYVLNLAKGLYRPNKHHELVKSLQALVGVTHASTQWVRGHSGDTFNESVDKLAKNGKKKYTAPKPVKKNDVG